MVSVADNSPAQYRDHLVMEIDSHVLPRLRVADASPLSVQTTCLPQTLCLDVEQNELRACAISRQSWPTRRLD